MVGPGPAPHGVAVLVRLVAQQIPHLPRWGATADLIVSCVPELERVQQAAEDLASDPRYTPEERRRLLTTRLSELLGVMPPSTGPGAAEAWTARVFEAIGEEYGVEGPVNDVERYALRVLEKILGEAINQARKASSNLEPEQEDEMVEGIYAAFSELDPDEQAKVAEQLGVDRVSKDAIHEALRTGVLFSALGGLLGASGFGGYLFVTQAIHAVFTSLLGIPIKFTVYKGAVGAFALLHNPVVLFVLAAGVGVVLLRNQQRHFRRRVGALCVLQIVTSRPAVTR